MVDLGLAVGADGLDLERHVPERLVVLGLDVAGAEETVLADLEAVLALLDGDDGEADLPRQPDPEPIGAP